MQPREAALGEARDEAAGDGWLETPALHGTLGAARLGSAPHSPDHPVEAAVILCIMNGRLSVLRWGSKARRWVS